MIEILASELFDSLICEGIWNKTNIIRFWDIFIQISILEVSQFEAMIYTEDYK
jgi:hypothetical protein